MDDNRRTAQLSDDESPPPSTPPSSPPPTSPSSAPSGYSEESAPQSGEQQQSSGGGSNGGARNPRGRAIWRGSLCLKGQNEEIKVDVVAYALRGRSTTRPSWPDPLVCDSRGLAGAEAAGNLASQFNNPGFARLQAVSATGEEVVDTRMTSVAEVIEERGAAFERVREGYMVVASRDGNNEIGLYVLYER